MRSCAGPKAVPAHRTGTAPPCALTVSGDTTTTQTARQPEQDPQVPTPSRLHNSCAIVVSMRTHRVWRHDHHHDAGHKKGEGDEE